MDQSNLALSTLFLVLFSLVMLIVAMIYYFAAGKNTK